MSNTDFEDKDLQYAYHSIHDFFDIYHLAAAIKDINRVIKVAARDKSWARKDPYTPVYLMEKLQDLATAAYCITRCYSTRKSCIVNTTTQTGDPDLEQKQNFISNNRFSTVWNSVPRYLSAAQYQHPYKAIQKFTAYATEKEWQQTCKDLGEYALSNSSIDDEYPCYRILGIQLHLLRLVEACHLLEIRSTARKPEPQTQKKK